MDYSTMREVIANHRGKIIKPYDVIFGLNGFDAIIAFSEHLSGSNAYVPSVKTIFQGCMEEAAMQEFNKGYKDIRWLARKYGMSERHLRRCISGK